jgi:hypothetical protein
VALFCKHQWEVLDKTVLPSAWEQTTKIGKFPDGLSERGMLIAHRKKLVVICSCTLCGKIKKFVEENPLLH